MTQKSSSLVRLCFAEKPRIPPSQDEPPRYSNNFERYTHENVFGIFINSATSLHITLFCSARRAMKFAGTALQIHRLTSLFSSFFPTSDFEKIYVAFFMVFLILIGLCAPKEGKHCKDAVVVVKLVKRCSKTSV